MAPLTDSTRWLPLSQYDATARHRLFCLPFVGRGASFYRVGARLPGKGFRSVRCSCRTRREAVGEAVSSHTALGDELAPYLDRPFSLFGHSLGAMIAELAIR